MEKKSINEKRRLINWWMRWDDLNWPNSDTHDRIKRRAEAAARADVTTAILFGAHFRWDYLPYFTILHDYIGTVAEELHKYGIELFDRHSVNLIHRYNTKEEMRRVILHSGPHLPFSPSREAAECWTYGGKRLNDFRMVDVRDRKPLYFPQYAGEGFCYNNPDFIDAYCNYAKRLVSDTGIDGLAAEDSVHYMHYISCACPHCLESFRKRTGSELAPISDRSFWGNWDNPLWNEWINMRYDAGKEFIRRVTAELPDGFTVTTCGSNSASYSTVGKACDAAVFADGGANYVHSEMCGNTPPYKHDPVTVNMPIIERLVTFSHHSAVARKRGIRSFSTGYGFTEPSAGIIWAINKMLDTDCLFSTLKARLGLPDHILRELPEEADVIGRAFGFEKRHPELFSGEAIGEVAVYYSEYTRDHTFFGNIRHGYYKDYSDTLEHLFSLGLCAHTVFEFPKDTKKYPLVILPGVADMREDELEKLEKYLKAGGKVIVSGPSPIKECKNTWRLPTHPELRSPEDFFDSVPNGVWVRLADWITETKVLPSADVREWREVKDGLYYNPGRISEDGITDGFDELCRRFTRKLPAELIRAEGYLTTMFENKDVITVHLLAADYDVDIDHELDDIRFHRSRVNLVNKVEPIGVDGVIELRSDSHITVYTPFSDEESTVEYRNGIYTITLPEGTSYAILKLDK